MKTNIKLFLLLLLLQGLCYASFAQNAKKGSCETIEPQKKPEKVSPKRDPQPVVDVDIPSEASRDPNEIIGLIGYDAVGSTDTFRWVSATQTLAYTVYFENDPDLATAAASKVTINVPLHPKLTYTID